MQIIRATTQISTDVRRHVMLEEVQRAQVIIICGLWKNVEALWSGHSHCRVRLSARLVTFHVAVAALAAHRFLRVRDSGTSPSLVENRDAVLDYLRLLGLMLKRRVELLVVRVCVAAST